MWPYNLSVRLPVFGLVSRCLTNYLIGHKSLRSRIAAFTGFPQLSPSLGHVLVLYSPVRR